MEQMNSGMSSSPSQNASPNQYDRYEPTFREHFDQTYANTGRSYEDYAHAYRHGCDLAADPQCKGKAWDEVKPYAREKWEAQNPGSFGEYEQAIGAGYATVGGL